MTTTAQAPPSGGGARAAATGRDGTDTGAAGRSGARERTSSPLGGALLLADLASCCSPIVGDEVLGEGAAERLAEVFRALAEPTRLRLVSLIASRPGAEACVCELTGPVGLSQPTISHHLRVLVDAGLLEREQRGKWAYYRLVPGAFEALARILPAAAAGRAH